VGMTLSAFIQWRAMKNKEEEEALAEKEYIF
jgi:hypothetical protein